MKRFITRTAWKEAAKHRIGSDLLAKASDRINQGLVDAEIGARLFKQRLGRKGDFRMILYLERDRRSVVLHMFPKNVQPNMTGHELRTLREFAACLPSSMTRPSFGLPVSATGKTSPMTSPTRTYRSGLLQSIHEATEDLHAIGAIDKATLRRFDVACLTPVEPMAPEAIRRIRERANMSQAIFAMALNVTTSLVSKWERGDAKPGGPSLKLLTLADRKGIDAIL